MIMKSKAFVMRKGEQKFQSINLPCRYRLRAFLPLAHMFLPIQRIVHIKDTYSRCCWLQASSYRRCLQSTLLSVELASSLAHPPSPLPSPAPSRKKLFIPMSMYQRDGANTKRFICQGGTAWACRLTGRKINIWRGKKQISYLSFLRC